jgi:hypothetical protein
VQLGPAAQQAVGEAEEAGAKEEGGPGQGESPSLPLGPYRVAKRRAMEEVETRATTASRSITLLLLSTFLFILENCTATYLLFTFLLRIRVYMIMHSFRSVPFLRS